MAETGQEIEGEQEVTESSGASRVREDLMTLTKARLSALVVMTTFFGYLLAARTYGTFSWGILGHTIFGTLLTAFGSAAFNQVMEIDADARMDRTSARPLPARRVSTATAFVLGFLLSAFGLVHLVMKVGFVPGVYAAATLLTYLFIYTPMKVRSSWNTVVGAVAGALPPLIGWTAAGGGVTLGAVYLFMLLFLWQMPHFLAINWMYRDQYVRGGFVMWSNDDDDGSKTSLLAIGFSVFTLLVPVLPVLSGEAAWWFLIPGVGLGAVMLKYAIQFRKVRTRKKARALFFYTLAYLPLILIFSLLAWKRTSGE
ncbi:MAG: protoheme IX farnesyltransferase [Verrucomicrobia bacterium]|nr:protoheme IX farnesyltransferase [Verrucomicrobiota bacterium]